MGADRAIHLYVENGENLDSWTTAMILAHSIRALGFDLIFCGRESVDDQCGLVGPYHRRDTEDSLCPWDHEVRNGSEPRVEHLCIVPLKGGTGRSSAVRFPLCSRLEKA